MKKIGIVAALPDEAKCLFQDKLTLSSPVEIQKNIFLCLSGIGEESAIGATQKLLEHDVDALISWGVAGAIDPELNIGDVLISESVFYQDKKYTSSLNWLDNINRALQTKVVNLKAGMIATTTDICSTIENKQSIFDKTNAIAVDMESGAIANIAKSNNIDFLILRSISDDANTAIPSAILNHTDHLGRPDLYPFLYSCIKHPSQILGIIKLAQCYKKALYSLKQIAFDLKKHHFYYTS